MNLFKKTIILAIIFISTLSIQAQQNKIEIEGIKNEIY